VVGFQRARSEEQREVRRRAILDTAAAMLREMPVADVSLNELSRRVGLAKSNVLRYFESREAVLLELLDDATAEWIAVLGPELARIPPGPVAGRCVAVADLLARTLTERPVLCDLFGAQAAVLERNVSPAVAARFKRCTLANVTAAAQLVRGVVPEVGEEGAVKFAGMTAFTAGAIWAHGQPSAAMLAAYEADPSLAALRIEFEPALAEVLRVLLLGWLAST
jgi:AcrR family transcriptional regulator